VHFKLISKLEFVEVIATGRGVKELRRLNKIYGKSHWRKLKGIAKIKLSDGSIKKAELHWYEAHGIGKKELKIKFYLD